MHEPDHNQQAGEPMGQRFIDLALLGDNAAWRYVTSLLMIGFFWVIVGGVPFAASGEVDCAARGGGQGQQAGDELSHERLLGFEILWLRMTAVNVTRRRIDERALMSGGEPNLIML